MNAARVRSLQYNSDAPQIDEETWAMIALHRPAASWLIPHLRHLDWEEYGESISYLTLFLSPELVDVTIRPVTPNLYTSLLLSVPQLCPRLRRFRIRDSFAAMMLPSDLATALLEGLPELRVYEGDSLVLQDQALARLACSKFIRVAEITPKSEGLSKMLAETATDEAQLFPVISRLHAHFSELDTWSLGLLRSVSSEHLVDVAMSAADPLQAILVEHLQLLHSTPRFKNIRKLSLKFPKARFAVPVPDPTHPELHIDSQVFDNIYPLTQLVKLEVTSFYIDVTDEIVQNIVKALPQIRVLLLLSNYCRARIPNVTFKSLIAIAQGCHRIKKLGLAFDAVEVGSATALKGIKSNLTLRMFLVNDSPISQPGRVALFLTALFSNTFLQISSDIATPGGNQAVRQQYAAMWREVQTQIPWMTQARFQEREAVYGEWAELTDSEDEIEESTEDSLMW